MKYFSSKMPTGLYLELYFNFLSRLMRKSFHSKTSSCFTFYTFQLLQILELRLFKPFKNHFLILVNWPDFNSYPPGQNGRHFIDDIFRGNFVNEKNCILMKISLKFAPRGPIDNNSSALVQIMPCRLFGDPVFAGGELKLAIWQCGAPWTLREICCLNKILKMSIYSLVQRNISCLVVDYEFHMTDAYPMRSR